jgi:aspartate kinase
MKRTLVMKFGGAAVASADCFARIADLILERKKDFSRIAVVVSAMGNTTDQLISLAKQVNPNPPQREYDMLLTTGERISIALLAMALAHKSQEAFSFTGSQSGIITCGRHTEASIIDVRPHRLLPVLEEGKIAIVAGFQGVSRLGEITTLGRGGSDTSAVALGVALGASRVEFYKDVPGICSEDPKVNAEATLYPRLSYEEALKIVLAGAKVLHARGIQLASKNELPLHVRSFKENQPPEGTWIGSLERRVESVAIYEQEMSLWGFLSTLKMILMYRRISVNIFMRFCP